jgi:glycosyltransferase involved in cell wall biosynthesis
MTPVVHLVYPHGPGIAAPDVIGRRLGEHLARTHEVRLYDWHASTAIRPQPGDLLLGHPHPVPGTTFRRNFGRPGWGRRLVLSPFNGDARQVAFLDPFVRAADAYLAITGKWWVDALPRTELAHWAPRVIHLDLAVDRADFPRVKSDFAPPGRRRLLYVGHSGWQKNVGYLSEIARARPDWDIGWLGRGDPGDIPGVTHLGTRDTSTASTRELVATYDVMLTVGRSDANPMSILEAMAWGLVPVCTPQSGYVDEPGVVNVPLDDLAGALAVLDHLQHSPDDRLVQARRANDRRLAEHFTWERFGDQVEAGLRADLPPAGRPSLARRLRLATVAATSPSGPLRGSGPRLVARRAIDRLRG